MKVIFLDVDGVLNHAGSTSRAPNGCIGVETDLIRLLKQIVDATDARIVLTSTWKQDWSRDGNHAPDGQYLVDCLEKEGLTIVDKTEDLISDRGAGIQRWLNSHGAVESWVVLDDDKFPDYEACGIMPHLVKTSFMLGGLMKNHVQQSINILNRV